MSLPTYVQDAKAVRISVYYEGSSTINEGMPVCYNYDTTTNWTAVDRNSTAGTYDTDTPEGSQNEGKFIRVENPATANLQWFAGVIAAGSPNLGVAGPGVVDIFVPNGAIVPVRSFVSSTVGKHALAIMNGQVYLGNPNASTTNGAARYVAVAEETVDRSSTAGLCLARLNPAEFAYQSHGATKLHFATAGTVDVAANFINVASSQTTGGFTGFWVRSETTACGNADTSLAIYGEANVLGVVSSSWGIGNRFAINLWGGTQTATLISGLMAEIYEQDTNLASVGTVAPFSIHDMVDATNGPAANAHWLIYAKVNGADKPDGLMHLAGVDADYTVTALTGDITWDSSDKKIPVKIASTVYYIPLWTGS